MCENKVPVLLPPKINLKHVRAYNEYQFYVLPHLSLFREYNSTNDK